MRWIVGAIIGAGLVMLTADARAERDVVCAGCLFEPAPGPTDVPRPLLVLLHGDEGSPSKLFGAWKTAAAQANVHLFAPKCPTSEGCAGSWWRWDRDPKWILDRVEDLGRRASVDPKKRYLAGWSGGTTYISFHVPRWFPTFAALSLAGGGAPSRDDGCFVGAGGPCGAVHYLAGDKNPLFSLAEGAHAYLERCGHDVTWELHPGADHAGEWRAYEREVGQLMTWLTSHEEGCIKIAPLQPPASAPGPAMPSDEQPSAAPAPAPRGVDSSNVPPVARDGRCTCGVIPGGDAGGWSVALLLGLAVLVGRRCAANP